MVDLVLVYDYMYCTLQFRRLAKNWAWRLRICHDFGHAFQEYPLLLLSKRRAVELWLVQKLQNPGKGVALRDPGSKIPQSLNVCSSPDAQPMRLAKALQHALLVMSSAVPWQCLVLLPAAWLNFRLWNQPAQLF